MSTEAMKMALETLERLDRWLALRYGNELTPPEREVVKALRTAIEQAEQGNNNLNYPNAEFNTSIEQAEKPWVKTYCGGKPNYCTPEVSPEVAGEDTGEVGACVTCGAPKGEWLVDAVNISQECVDETVKREHEWVGLTEEELEDLLITIPWPQVCRAIEAKLKEKNT